ncbi:MAG: hypothetical protein KGZ86_01840, partial [Candidatus Latescibacteria bacterium]|nr:hypothetical protein [Candidatus Latescibacterota bacterium]
MKYIIMCLVLVLSFSIAEKIDMPSRIVTATPHVFTGDGAVPRQAQVKTPEIIELEKKMEQAIEMNNIELAREYERQISEIRYPTPINIEQENPEFQAIAVSDNGFSPLPFNWGSDRLVRAGELRDFACDYDTNGIMWVAVSCPDSTIRLYRSINHGVNWTQYQGWFHPTKDYYTKVGLVVTTGDSGFAHVYMRHRNNGGDLYFIRVSKTNPATYVAGNIGATADTIDDFSVCEDYFHNYYLYLFYVNEQRSGQNAKYMRSLNYGKTWVDTLNWGNGFDPSVSFVSYYRIVAAFRTPSAPGRLYMQVNTYWGHPDSWTTFNYVNQDTFYSFNPRIAATNTRPDSAATVWVLYTHNYANSGDYDMDYSYSTNGGRTFTTGQHLSWTTNREVLGNIRHYRIYPNSYVNACYTSYTLTPSLASNVYWSWANGPAPTAWATRVQVNDAGSLASTGTGGKLIYSPHAPGSGGGVVYPRYGPDSLFFDANWVGIEELPPVTPINNIISVNPNPFTNQITINYQINKPGKVALMIYDAAGREVKSITNGNIGQGDYRFVWNGKDNNNRTINNG